MSLQLEDIRRLKQINKVQRICIQKSGFLTKDLVTNLISMIRILRKQREFLKKKLREKHGKNKSEKTDES